ncbi:sigma-70 family RNA polymerase sigma factor [Phenylobacterium sp.]|uniref:RNA polymerase sigma factor n=1 Tax=Phenylobacterium sp. TaxID=1871053 RepID=UPI002F41D565
MDLSQGQDERYAVAAAEFGAAVERLARGYEANPEARRDLVQDIHLALWRSLSAFDGRCSLRTWVYRVAHNTAVSHVQRGRRWRREGRATLEELERLPDADDPETAVGERQALSRLMALIQALGPPDRQVALLYLEDLDAAAIGEITGLSAGAVAVRIHRLKALLARRFAEGGRA